jgi:tetratricopeptide (TPR) repeat protein
MSKAARAKALDGAGWLALDQGDVDRAKDAADEGLKLITGVRTKVDVASSLRNMLGGLARMRGNYERATTLSEEALSLRRRRGHSGDLGYALTNLGWAALLRGDHEQADAFLTERLALCREQGAKLVATENLEGLACEACASGEPGRAARLFGAARVLQEAVGYPRSPKERALREPYLTAVRSQLDEARGKRLSPRGRR